MDKGLKAVTTKAAAHRRQNARRSVTGSPRPPDCWHTNAPRTLVRLGPPIVPGQPPWRRSAGQGPYKTTPVQASERSREHLPQPPGSQFWHKASNLPAR